jgi:dTDP-4-dehydrorhamnose 3,5-epimerase
LNRFTFAPTPIAGVTLLERHPISDDRGQFERMYCAEELQPLLGDRSIAQINRSLTADIGSVRGLHYQRGPYAELKIVTCLKGAVFDVAVDLRRGSPTFLHWHGQTLSAGDHRAMVIAEGIAHGFQTLTADSELLYLHTAAYAPEAYAGINPNDPRVGIVWPLPVTTLSAQDANRPMLSDNFVGIAV